MVPAPWPGVDEPGTVHGMAPIAFRRRPRGRGRSTVTVLLLLLVLFGPSEARAGPVDAAGRTAGREADPEPMPGAETGDGGARASPLGFRSPMGGPPVVLTPFAPPSQRYGAGHRGVDLAAAAGSTIRAAGAGTVVFAGRVADRPVVSIEHDGGLRTTYEPVEPSVGRGARVVAGDVIGVLVAGHPSCPGLDCLHWGARLPDRVYLDPLLLLDAWPVRLWPWDEP